SRRDTLDLLHRAASGLVEGDAAVGVVDAVAFEDLEPLLLPGAGDPEDGDLLSRVLAQIQTGLDHAPGDDVHARVRHDRHHHGDLVHARLREHQLRQPAGLRHRGVAADLAVVGRPAAVRAHGVEQRERSATRADYKTEVAVELGHVPRDAAVVGGVHLLAGQLELRRLAGLARLVLAHAQFVEQPSVTPASLVLHL